MPADSDKWILLRGLARESSHWLDFPQYFEGRVGPCFELDLPGTGKLHKLRSPYRIGDMTEFVRAQRAFMPKGKYYALGLSLGAMVLFDWAISYPGELAGIVLINTSRGDLSPAQKRMKPEAVVKLLKAKTATSLLDQELQILSVVSNKQEHHREWAERWAEIARERPISRTTLTRQLVAAAMFRIPNRIPQVPILVLSSMGDAMVDTSCSTLIADQWGCDIQRHPWGGHDLPLDDPEWVVDKVLDWRRRLDKSAL